jgi:hypothetical protein
MSARRLLAAADLMLHAPAAGTRGLWPRACAWLLRLALEAALDELWTRSRPALKKVSMRAQLLVLPTVVGPRTAGRAANVWDALSRAGHHHAFELAPTAAELRRWHDEVAVVITAAEAVTGPLAPAMPRAALR